ncbi:unnamed protein product [Arabidopsis thaliana]|uniref:KIB1-4 beta-propeller domain-containing protein n=1 Tax=Arabidopsis thaliana TaxID=3702 RepID=A0A5S9X8U6_ARATH|nr:unnamed protein product [Arabidopsis thaliana]
MSLKKEMWDSNEKTCDDSNQPILVVDLIRSILERLSFVDFHRARCISSLWYTASESCIGGPSTPWIILFPNEFVERNNDSYYNNDFHVLNLFTRERIPLPSLESTDGFPMNITNRLDTAVLWVDEKSRDYLVAWSYGDIFAYRKNGDGNNSWKVIEPLKNQRCVDMVCKESKLYVFSDTRVTFHKSPVVTLSGEVLVIASRVEPHPGTFLFFVYKLDPKSSKWSIIKSIGDEALILDLGIIVAAKDGVMKNCIYLVMIIFISTVGLVYAVITVTVFSSTILGPKRFEDARILSIELSTNAPKLDDADDRKAIHYKSLCGRGLANMALGHYYTAAVLFAHLVKCYAKWSKNSFDLFTWEDLFMYTAWCGLATMKKDELEEISERMGSQKVGHHFQHLIRKTLGGMFKPPCLDFLKTHSKPKHFWTYTSTTM